MSALKITVSGVRGVIGSTLTTGVALDFGKAFGTFMSCGKIAIARDTRTSGTMIKYAVVAGLLSSGCEVIDIGVVPTPTALYYVKKNKVDGGIIITASHNPSQWNGLKFIDADSTFLKGARLEKFFDKYYRKEFRTVAWDIMKPIREDESAIGAHIEGVLKHLDVKAIRKKRFKVACDYINGAGCGITPHFLTALGCKVVGVNENPSGIFAHEPEPLAKNLKSLCRLVKQKKADIGFAQDPDADRLAVVSEKGLPIGEELTLALSVKFVLTYLKKGVVVANLSSSKVVDHIAEEFKVKLIRTKVGESNVVEEMKKRNAVIGGEGNGGVIFPKINFGRDSIVGMGLLLEYLAKSGKKVSCLVDELPRFEMIKGKVHCPLSKTADVIRFIKGLYENENINETDGLKVVWPGKWIHVRPSNTEPIVRIITEAKTKKEAESLYNGLLKKITEIIG